MTTVLDLDVLFYPCPKNGPNFRPKAIQMGGKKQFPYMVCHAICLLLINSQVDLDVLIVLYYTNCRYISFQVDPNTGVAMYESDDIIKYLADKYGALSLQPFQICISDYIFSLLKTFFFSNGYSFWIGDGTVPLMLSLGLFTVCS